MSIFFVNTQDAQISNAFLATLGAAPGSTYLAQVKTFGLVPSVQAMINATGSSTAAALSTKVATNLGLTGSALTGGTAYLSSVTFAGSSSAWAANLMETLNLFSTLQSDATYGSAATAYLARVNSAVSYSSVATNNSTDLSTLAAAVGSAGSTGAGSTFTLTTGVDTGAAFTGGAFSDTFNATGATLGAQDVLNGGAGKDKLVISDTTKVSEAGLTAATFTSIEALQLTTNGGVGAFVKTGVPAVAGTAQTATIVYTASVKDVAASIVIAGVTYSATMDGTGDTTGAKAAVAVAALINTALGAGVAVVSTATVTVTSPFLGTPLPTLSTSGTGGTTVGVVAGAANVEKVLATGAQAQIVSVVLGGTGDATATITLFVDGVNRGSFAADTTAGAAKRDAAAAQIATELNKVLGSSVVSATGATINATAPVAGTPLPLFNVVIAGTVATTVTRTEARANADPVVADIAAVVFNATAFTENVTANGAGDMNVKAADTAAVILNNSTGKIEVDGGKTVAVNTSGTGTSTIKGKALTEASVNGGGAVDIDNLGGAAGTTSSSGTTMTKVTLNKVDANSAVKGAALTELTLLGAVTGARTVTVSNATADHTLTINAAGTGYAANGTTEHATVVTDAAAKTFAINASAKSILNLATGNTALTTVTVAGAGALKLATDASGITSIDASASTGGVNIGAVHANTVTVKGGSGADRLTLDSAAKVNVNLGNGADRLTLSAAMSKDSVIVGGDGIDTLIVTDATATLITNDNKPGISGFETLEVAAATVTIDFEALTGFTNLVLAASTALDVRNISTSAGGDILVTGDQATSLILGIKNAETAGNTDTAKLTLDHVTADTDVDIVDLHLAGVENLVVVSQGAPTAPTDGTQQNSIGLSNASTVLSSIVISGTSEFKLFMNGGNESLSKIATINASGLTAKAEIDLAGNNFDTTVTMTGLADIFTGGNGVDTVNLGAGNDTYNSSSGLDVVTLGAGVNNVVLSTATADATDTLTIADFKRGAGGDTITVDESAVAGGIVTGMTIGTTTFLKVDLGAIGVNDLATTLTDNTFIVVKGRAFANYDAVELELDLENGGTDLADLVVIFFNSTSNRVEMYADGVVGNTNTADEIHLVTFTGMALADLEGFASTNFIVG